MSPIQALFLEFVPVLPMGKGAPPLTNPESLLMKVTKGTSLTECAEWVANKLGKENQVMSVCFLLGEFGPHTVNKVRSGEWEDEGNWTVGKSLCYDQPILIRYGTKREESEVLDLSLTSSSRGRVPLMSTWSNVSVVGTIAEEEEKKQIFVQTLSGKTITASVALARNVEELKTAIYLSEGIPPAQQSLSYAGKILDDRKRSLNSYCIKPESTVNLALRVRGGSGGYLRFVDVTRDDALYTQDWNPKAPDFRLASPGLSIEGRCMTRGCKAFKKSFVSNEGFANFDLTLDGSCVCPLCHGSVAAIKPGFNNCLWKVVAEKETSMSIFKTPWMQAGDNYTTYDEHLAGVTTEFSRLQIFVRKVPGSEESNGPPVGQVECGLCLDELNDGKEIREVPGACGHYCHCKCWKRWKKEGMTFCPMCRVEE